MAPNTALKGHCNKLRISVLAFLAPHGTLLTVAKQLAQRLTWPAILLPQLQSVLTINIYIYMLIPCLISEQVILDTCSRMA